MTTSPSRTKTPPALKWLLNERAALEGALLRTQTAVGTLQKRVQVLQAALGRHEESARACQAGIAALDVSISLLHPEIGEDRPAPVNAWQGKYGARGGLQTFLLERAREAAPAPVTSSKAAEHLAAQLGLDIGSSALRQRLLHSVREAFRQLAKQGLVERAPTHYLFMLGHGAPAAVAAFGLAGLRFLSFDAGSRRARLPVLNPSEGLAIYRQGYLALFLVLALGLYLLEFDGFLVGFKDHSTLGSRVLGQLVTAAASGLVLGGCLARTPYLLIDVVQGWAFRLLPAIALLHSVGWCVLHPLRALLTAAESWGRLATEIGIGFAANLAGVVVALLFAASLRSSALIFSTSPEKST